MTSSDGVRLDSLCHFIFLREKTNAATFTPLHNKFKHKQPKTTSQTRLHNNHKRTVDSYQVVHVLKTISWTDDIFLLIQGVASFQKPTRMFSKISVLLSHAATFGVHALIYY